MVVDVSRALDTRLDRSGIANEAPQFVIQLPRRGPVIFHPLVEVRGATREIGDGALKGPIVSIEPVSLMVGLLVRMLRLTIEIVGELFHPFVPLLREDPRCPARGRVMSECGVRRQ